MKPNFITKFGFVGLMMLQMGLLEVLRTPCIGLKLIDAFYRFESTPFIILLNRVNPFLRRLATQLGGLTMWPVIADFL